MTTMQTLAARFLRGSARPSLLEVLRLRRQRMRLGGLDDRMLEDIGLSRSDAEEEARRALWDVPRHWRA